MITMPAVFTDKPGSKNKVFFCHVEGPSKLLTLGLVVNFLYWHLMFLAP